MTSSMKSKGVNIQTIILWATCIFFVVCQTMFVELIILEKINQPITVIVDQQTCDYSLFEPHKKAPRNLLKEIP